MKNTFIYCLIDPRDNQIRYIGKSNNPKQRLKNHCNPARYRPTHKFNWIRKLRQLELKPILKILEEVDIEIWKQKEKYWIDFYKSEGCNIVNYTDGGDGLSFGNQTSFKKGRKPWNKDIIKHRNCEFCGKNFKPRCSKCKQKYCSKICSGKSSKSSTKFKTNCEPWNKNKKGYKTTKRRPVLQFSLNNVFIQEFSSCKEAAEKFNCGTENIRNAAVGRSKTAKGFIWKYKIIINE